MLWNENISCLIKKCHSHQVISSSKYESGHPKLWSEDALPMLVAEELGDARSKVNRKRGLAPDRWRGAYEGEFSEPQGLHLPIHWVLNSLTWYLTFVVQTACSLCFKLVYSWLPLRPPWSSFLRDTERLSPRLSVWKHSHQKKKKKNFFKGCDYIVW